MGKLPQRRQRRKNPLKVQGNSRVRSVLRQTRFPLVEAKNNAMIIMNMNALMGNLEYKNRTESVDGKTVDNPQPETCGEQNQNSLKFKSAFIKEIHMEEDKAAGALNIRIETMGKQFTL